MSVGTEYTIDELARAAGTTVRSLRVYHERGVLPPPQVKGRTGFYGQDHLNRVHTISRLLDRGIKLNGIKELLAAWDRGDDLGVILGVGGDVPPDTEASSGETISATELEERFHGVPQGLARVVALGMYEPVDATTYRVADPQLARNAEVLAATGVPADVLLTELERLYGDCDRIARRFADLFQRTAWSEYQQSERGSEDLGRLSERADTTRTVPARMSAELIARLVARYLDQDSELAEVLSGS
ncbi:MerR family transcriptional regulator [Nocardia wallacei]|uniref:MerR family transcriptional regulator n=1 Tax=Nocardia wallacei TaxID=480035 RepID=UPI002453F8DE|nr:MerR family transcriptional regulator [Nocardia wallacei]